jgi:amidophosphoribosyltransferase
MIKNRYVHRTFIRPDQTKREKDVQLKLNPLRDALHGKRVVVVDDSLVRGTTTGQIVRMLREVGVSQIHLRISSPPVLYPDFYGIDTPNQEKLIAARLKDTKKIRRYVGATSLEYLSYKGMLKAIGMPESNLCTACFSGNYPIDLLERKKEFKKIPFSS